MPERRRVLGDVCERHAEQYLRRQGYLIVERNLRTRWGELDLIARQGDEIVFVEVKSRQAGAQTPPVESVTPAKVRRLVRLAEAYLEALGGEEPPWRIDVVTVVVDGWGRVLELTHIPAAVC